MTVFKYIKGQGLVKPTIQKIGIVSCCKPFLWYEDKVGQTFFAEEKKEYWYVKFEGNTKTQKGGIVEKCDVRVL